MVQGTAMGSRMVRVTGRATVRGVQLMRGTALMAARARLQGMLKGMLLGTVLKRVQRMAWATAVSPERVLLHR
jgi:hypothetical protein